MLHLSVDQDIRSRTLRNIQRRFMIDTEQAQRVTQLAAHLVNQLDDAWELESLSRELLASACELHEIGLSVDFKRAPQHAAYLVSNLDPGFTPAQKKTARDATAQPDQHHRPLLAPSTKCSETTGCRALVSAAASGDPVASRRRDDLLPAISLAVDGEKLVLTLPEDGWKVIRWVGRWWSRSASGKAMSTGLSKWLNSA